MCFSVCHETPNRIYKGGMMKLENQVTSLELAKQLKEAGYPQEGLFYWWKKAGLTPKVDFHAYVKFSNYVDLKDIFVVAPTVAELGEALPDFVAEDFGLEMIKIGKSWVINYTWEYVNESGAIGGESSENLAECFALMWLKLKEEGLL